MVELIYRRGQKIVEVIFGVFFKNRFFVFVVFVLVSIYIYIYMYSFIYSISVCVCSFSETGFEVMVV